MKKFRLKINMNEKESKLVSFLYETCIGRFFLKIISSSVISKLIGGFLNSKISTVFINGFVKKNKIDLNEYEDKKYLSYNDFFTRKIRTKSRIIDFKDESFISPCDSKLCIYKINKDSVFKIKNSLYQISDLLKNYDLAKKYEDGYCLIFRLCVDDYHRYCYVDSGKKNNNVFIKGKLYTVRPIALNHFNIYKENSREYTILQTDNFGDIVQVEVGATLVGKIKNYHNTHIFSKGDEKGMFEFGGSTIVLLVEKNKVLFDEEIMKNTKDGYETVVKYGEKIGTKI